MKKFRYLIAGCSLLFTACASELQIAFTDVPPAVVSACNQKYPQAKITGWEIQKEKNEPMVFEAGFIMNGRKSSAEFKPDGTFVREE